MLSGCNACDACDIRRVYIDEGFALQVETWHNDNWRYDFLTMTDAQEQLTEIITAIDEAE